MADHEDYLSGEAPMAHAASHEFGGSDQISVDALSGLLSDAQYPLIHPLGGDAHQADILADLNSKVTDATLEDKTVLENTMDAKVATHAALPTVHQDAPALILTHKGDASAHHAKYTDAEARASINDIFGSDGKADADISMDMHKIIGAGTIDCDSLYYSAFSIADDNFITLSPGNTIGIIVVNPRYTVNSTVNGMVCYRCQAASFSTIMCQSSNIIEVTTGVLNGTTGNDGKVTVSPHTDNKIYIENRFGGTIYIGVTFFGA